MRVEHQQFLLGYFLVNKMLPGWFTHENYKNEMRQEPAIRALYPKSVGAPICDPMLDSIFCGGIPNPLSIISKSMGVILIY